MPLPSPVRFHADLTHDRLTAIAEALLEEHNKTVDDLVSDTDDSYTRGCTAFGRQKNRIKQMSLSGRYPWLRLRNSANDLVFQIGSVPCRFSSDDPKNPKKGAVIEFNRHQTSFFNETENDEPCRFCFVVDVGHGDEVEPSVVFMGFDAVGTLRCEWSSDAVQTLHNVNTEARPSAVKIDKPPISPKKPSTESDIEEEGS
jgi:hypothetical protein